MSDRVEDVDEGSLGRGEVAPEAAAREAAADGRLEVDSSGGARWARSWSTIDWRFRRSA